MIDGADIVVVGGGPAGASTAWMLARAGVDVLVLDRARFPREKPCAEYLSPQGSRVLAEMGVLEQIEQAGAAHLSGMMVRAPSGIAFRGDFAANHGFRGFRDRGLALRRPVLDTLLLRAAEAAGARVREGQMVVDVARNGSGAAIGVRVRDTARDDSSPTDGADTVRTIAARIVVGADGLRSIVARRLGLAHPRRRPRRVAFVTHFRGVADIGTAGEMHVERDGYIGLADVGHGETNVALVVPAKLARGGDRAVFLSRWLDGHPHLAGRFRHAERTSPVVATGPFAHRTRRAWAPGAALVGDAAEFYDPFTGEGIYTALRSGELLAGYAHAALADPRPTHMARCLAAYDRCWRHEFRGKLAVERLVSAAVASPALLERAARALAGRRDLADLFVGVTGDFVPAREVLRPSYLLRLLFPGRAPAAAP